MREIREVKLERLQQFAAFGISDDVIREYEKENVVPFFYLDPEDYALFGCSVPKVGAPTVAVLLGREKGYYASDWDIIMSIVKAGAEIETGIKLRFLTYEHTVEQMQGCQALFLQGGSFASPERYYTDPAAEEGEDDFPCLRAEAYVLAIRRAVKSGMPILAVCAGAQLIAAEVAGWKLYRDQSYLPSGHLEHKTKKPYAHMVEILPGTPLKRLLHNQACLHEVNSRHDETVVPPVPCEDAEFAIYAKAPDGVPEAWGCAKRHILCLQWHPENYAAKGDAMMQRIFGWLGQEAAWYHNLL